MISYDPYYNWDEHMMGKQRNLIRHPLSDDDLLSADVLFMSKDM